jgi:hypothetical protein
MMLMRAILLNQKVEQNYTEHAGELDFFCVKQYVIYTLPGPARLLGSLLYLAWTTGSGRVFN